MESSSSPANDDEARTITITMPDSESAQIVLRTAYNEIASKMVFNTNPEFYIKYANEIKKSMEKGVFNSLNLI